MQTIQLIQDEGQLVQSLICGSEKAFKILYDLHKNRIYRVALRYLKCETESQEVVQDVFMKFWLQRETIQVDRPVEAWLYTVAKNNILNKLKKQANQWKLINQFKNIQVTEDNSLQENIQHADYEVFLKNTLNSLPEKQLVVYTLARNENLSYIQIAEQLNISPLTVKTHMSRALCFIRNVIESKKILL